MYPLAGSMYGQKHRMKVLGFVVIAATMIKSSLFFKYSLFFKVLNYCIFIPVKSEI
jgi:hypothetical protein